MLQRAWLSAQYPAPNRYFDKQAGQRGYFE